MYSLGDWESACGEKQRPSIWWLKMLGSVPQGLACRTTVCHCIAPENRNSEGIRIASGQELEQPQNWSNKDFQFTFQAKWIFMCFFSVSWKALTISGVYGLSSSSLTRISINQVNYSENAFASHHQNPKLLLSLSPSILTRFVLAESNSKRTQKCQASTGPGLGCFCSKHLPNSFPCWWYLCNSKQLASPKHCLFLKCRVLLLGSSSISREAGCVPIALKWQMNGLLEGRWQFLMGNIVFQ